MATIRDVATDTRWQVRGILPVLTDGASAYYTSPSSTDAANVEPNVVIERTG